MPGEWGATYTGDRDDLIVLGGDGGCDTEQKAKDRPVGRCNDARHRRAQENC